MPFEVFARLSKSDSAATSEVDLFGFSYIWLDLRDMIMHLTQHSNIHVYTLTPFVEFSVDLSSLVACTFEMEFLFPFPRDVHPSVAEDRSGKLMIERGYIKGFVDLVIDHKDRVYFADWKSDLLPSYDSATIISHVATHYDVQITLYLLALVKALDVHSEAAYDDLFGDLFCVFLRASGQVGQHLRGVHFKRPGWKDILRYEADLKRFDPRIGKDRI